eukprot:2735003-Heterocapsa_arctica.AAC.1
MLDFVITSAGVIQIMDSCVADLAVPWSPHFGLEVRLSTSTEPIARNVLNSPQTFRTIPAFSQGQQ